MASPSPNPPPPIRGIHHVTAIASDPQRNLDFYTKVLGLRFVKRTVNFDDPGTYHFYFGDERGRPGTILTFFPWPGARRGSPGSGQVNVTSFLVPPGSVERWQQRLLDAGANVEAPSTRFGDRVLRLYDPDDMELKLVEHAEAAAIDPWRGSPVPAELAVRGVFGVTMCVTDPAPTQALLTETMGLRAVAEEGNRVRYLAAGGATEPGRRMDVVATPDSSPGHVAAGIVHHVAFRVRDDAEQSAWLDALFAAGQHPTPVQERQYFRSIYFREPGGVLFELATDGPGFTADEPVEHLGETLKLPPWLEPQRRRIEKVLPTLR